ncbi:MAG: hypothetical protein ACLP50_03610 [Solirubrobacteraceae bacterium]
MTRISKRAVAGLAAVAAAVAAPVAVAAASSSSSSDKTIVHVTFQRGGTEVVSGYDGGAPLAPGP